ncbi:hypothetical protein E1B28_000003 [Marasmius oreades]|uniref:Uncharacterized protein n=1 Tax=Marasmius oreades TaxID=181124 RepID=A0A9P7V0J0_9AGAR|nr:uncharacterized protein E1B28_000003 [Marasmius oreades]KAG7098027.1 hypothetical protein E1B28_000003 [Marasmius oreades]
MAKKPSNPQTAAEKKKNNKIKPALKPLTLDDTYGIEYRRFHSGPVEDRFYVGAPGYCFWVDREFAAAFRSEAADVLFSNNQSLDGQFSKTLWDTWFNRIGCKQCTEAKQPCVMDLDCGRAVPSCQRCRQIQENCSHKIMAGCRSLSLWSLQQGTENAINETEAKELALALGLLKIEDGKWLKTMVTDSSMKPDFKTGTLPEANYELYVSRGMPPETGKGVSFGRVRTTSVGPLDVGGQGKPRVRGIVEPQKGSRAPPRRSPRKLPEEIVSSSGRSLAVKAVGSERPPRDRTTRLASRLANQARAKLATENKIRMGDDSPAGEHGVGDTPLFEAERGAEAVPTDRTLEVRSSYPRALTDKSPCTIASITAGTATQQEYDATRFAVVNSGSIGRQSPGSPEGPLRDHSASEEEVSHLLGHSASEDVSLLRQQLSALTQERVSLLQQLESARVNEAVNAEKWTQDKKSLESELDVLRSKKIRDAERYRLTLTHGFNSWLSSGRHILPAINHRVEQVKGILVEIQSKHDQVPVDVRAAYEELRSDLVQLVRGITGIGDFVQAASGQHEGVISDDRHRELGQFFRARVKGGDEQYTAVGRFAIKRPDLWDDAMIELSHLENFEHKLAKKSRRKYLNRKEGKKEQKKEREEEDSGTGPGPSKKPRLN